MAFYIDINKLTEDEQFAEYQFISMSDEKKGLLRLNKKTGEVILLKSVHQIPKDRISQRAAARLIKHWRDGYLPKSTCWAS
jgi:PIN domain nuclease of toxin-antitoxin system